MSDLGSERLAPDVIAVTGPIGAGKTTLSKQITLLTGWSSFTLSESIAKVAVARGLPVTRRVLQQIGAELLAEGSAPFVKRVLDDGGWIPGTGFVADGVRQEPVYKALASHVAPLPAYLVYLDIPFAVRAQRIAARDSLTPEELRDTEKYPVEQDLLKLRAIADIVIDTLEPPAKLAVQLVGWLSSQPRAFTTTNVSRSTPG